MKLEFEKNVKSQKIHKVAIELISKYTGESIYLGCTYNSYNDAQRYIDESICTKCNRTSIYPVCDGSIWVDKHHPLRPLHHPNK
jgi:hypothetical protein